MPYFEMIRGKAHVWAHRRCTYAITYTNIAAAAALVVVVVVVVAAAAALT
jgi:hypothetical protein